MMKIKAIKEIVTKTTFWKCPKCNLQNNTSIEIYAEDGNWIDEIKDNCNKCNFMLLITNDHLYKCEY